MARNITIKDNVFERIKELKKKTKAGSYSEALEIALDSYEKYGEADDERLFKVSKLF